MRSKKFHGKTSKASQNWKFWIWTITGSLPFLREHSLIWCRFGIFTCVSWSFGFFQFLLNTNDIQGVTALSSSVLITFTISNTSTWFISKQTNASIRTFEGMAEAMVLVPELQWCSLQVVALKTTLMTWLSETFVFAWKIIKKLETQRQCLNIKEW